MEGLLCRTGSRHFHKTAVGAAGDGFRLFYLITHNTTDHYITAKLLGTNDGSGVGAVGDVALSIESAALLGTAQNAADGRLYIT